MMWCSYVPLVRLQKSMSSIETEPNMQLIAFQVWGPLDSIERRDSSRGEKGVIEWTDRGIESKRNG